MPQDYHDDADVWTLIRNDRFEEAVRQADKEYERSNNILSLRNKVYALFQLRMYPDAFALAETIIKSTAGRTDSDFIFCGIALWLMGRESLAIEIWQKGENSTYTDAAGGIELSVILYFAAIKTGNSELKKRIAKRLRKIQKSKKSEFWPGIFASFILGESSIEVLLEGAVTVSSLTSRQLCQSHFVIAVQKLDNDDYKGYEEHLTLAVGFDSSSYIEQMYYLAKGELEKRR